MRVWFLPLSLQTPTYSLPPHVLLGSPCLLSVRSPTCLGLPSCCSYFVGYFMFSSLAASLGDCSSAPLSTPLNFFSLGRVCSPLWFYSPLLPSCLATASHGFLLWLTAYAVRGLFPLVMRLSFGCLLAHAGVPGWSSFLVVLFLHCLP